MADELQAPPSKSITVAGRRLTIHRKSLERTLQRFTLMEEAKELMNGNSVPQPGERLAVALLRNFRLITYPSLVASTTGNLPTEEECLQISEDDLELWLATAREINPEWFPPIRPRTVEETQEKKETPG